MDHGTDTECLDVHLPPLLHDVHQYTRAKHFCSRFFDDPKHSSDALCCCLVEICVDDEVRDLLSTSPRRAASLEVVTHPVTGPVVKGASRSFVRSADELALFLSQACALKELRSSSLPSVINEASDQHGTTVLMCQVCGGTTADLEKDRVNGGATAWFVDFCSSGVGTGSSASCTTEPGGLLSSSPELRQQLLAKIFPFVPEEGGTSPVGPPSSAAGGDVDGAPRALADSFLCGGEKRMLVTQAFNEALTLMLGRSGGSSEEDFHASGGGGAALPPSFVESSLPNPAVGVVDIGVRTHVVLVIHLFIHHRNCSD